MSTSVDDPQVDFDDAALAASLDCLSGDVLDALPFGLVVMDRDGVVLAYNRVESRQSGLDPSRVVGRRFFTDVGPCCNNAAVAGRYETADELDVVLDYVFAFRLRHVPVRIRLLHRAGSPRQYLAVVPR
jgi:photoactive yellow protein